MRTFELTDREFESLEFLIEWIYTADFPKVIEHVNRLSTAVNKINAKRICPQCRKNIEQGGNHD